MLHRPVEITTRSGTSAYYCLGGSLCHHPALDDWGVVSIVAELSQEEDFFYSVAKFEVMIGGITVSQEGQFSGYLRGGDVKGVPDGCIPRAPDCVGAAVWP